MNIYENEVTMDAQATPPRVKLRMLQQMAEALEDEAAVLNRRASVFDEDEQSLVREISDRQTEINRLSLKLEALRSEHKGLIDQIQIIRKEAAAIREEVLESEEEVALQAIETSHRAESRERWTAPRPVVERRTSVFFQRILLPDLTG